MLGFPVVNLRAPAAREAVLLRFVFGFQFLKVLDEFLHHAFDVADDRDIGDAVFADFGRVDIDMDDAGVAGKGGELASDAVVKPDAESDKKVAVGDAHVGGVTAVHARHADEVRMAGGQAAETHQSADGGRVGEFDEFREFGGCVGRDDAATRIDEGPFRFPNQLRGAADLAGVAFRENLVAGQVDAFHGNVVAARLEHVFRDVHEHWAGTTAGRDIESFVNDLGKLFQSSSPCNCAWCRSG